MIEIVVVIAIVVVGMIAASGGSPGLGTARSPLDGAPTFSVSGTTELVDDVLDAGDLPCPWCLAPTAETDRRCPSCGQRFG